MAGNTGESMAIHRLCSGSQQKGQAEPEYLAAGPGALSSLPDDGGNLRAAPPAPLASGPGGGVETPPGYGATGEDGALLDVLSRGSKNHFGGKCHPCRHATCGGTCPLGAECNCCHYRHGPEKFRVMRDFALSHQSKKKKRMDARREAADAWMGSPPWLAQPPLGGVAGYFAPPPGLQISAGGWGFAAAAEEPLMLLPRVMEAYGQWAYAPEYAPLASSGTDLLEPAYVTSESLSKPPARHEPFWDSTALPSFS